MATESGRLSFLEARLALEELNTNFCFYLDHGEIDLLLGLFTEDAIYIHGTRHSSGRAEIATVFDKRREAGPRTARHLYSGLRVHMHAADHASGSSVCMTFASQGEAPLVPAIPHLVADFFDDYVRGDDGIWRIRKRRIERIFVAADNPGPVGQTPQNTRLKP
jgi:hypothetical protein